MKWLSLLLILLTGLSCNDPNNSLATENDQLKKENDSLKQEAQSIAEEKDSIVTTPAPQGLEKEGVHPISLQWISWDKKGEVKIVPIGEGWYSISGSQANADNDLLRIEGKIRRVGKKELEFDGSIETKVKYNNNGEPCIKNGKQKFIAKGNRTYYRLQQMENCEGGRLVDYVDIYPGTRSL